MKIPRYITKSRKKRYKYLTLTFKDYSTHRVSNKARISGSELYSGNPVLFPYSQRGTLSAVVDHVLTVKDGFIHEPLICRPQTEFQGMEFAGSSAMQGL